MSSTSGPLRYEIEVTTLGASQWRALDPAHVQGQE